MPAKLFQIQDESVWLEKRKSYVTSTESSSLFGLQMPSQPTAYELWHIKRGLIESEIEPNQRMLWGKRLERSIAEGICEDSGWKLNPMKAFAYDNDDKIGSSYDYVITTPDKGPALLEIKTVSYRDYKEKFIEDDERDSDGRPVFIEAPSYYEIQVQHELEVLDKYHWVLLAVFVMDTRDVKLLWRERDKEMGSAIRKKVREFWSSEKPPSPDLIKDSDLLSKMHKANSKDKTYDGTKDSDFELSAISYIQETEKEKNAAAAKKKARSEMILAMGDCNTAWCNSARVSNKQKWNVTEVKKGK